MRKALLRQDATWWPVDGNDPYDEDSVVHGNPQLIKVRWEESAQLDTDYDDGTEIRTADFDTRIFVDREVYIEDYIALGNFTKSKADPQDIPEAKQIKEYTALSDIRYLEMTRIAYV